jgi:tetratricopeptide (TPR) repeat protein
MEWTKALQYKKPVIPLILHPETTLPWRLGTRKGIHFSGDFGQALTSLENHLNWIATPEGHLQSLVDRLTDAERYIEHAKDAQRRERIQEEITLLQKQIDHQQSLVMHPQEIASRVEENIQLGLERERKPAEPKSGRTTTKFINPPPAVTPSYFQNRHAETKLVVDFLRDNSKSLMTIKGGGGVGKTALVCRLLDSLEGGRLPDDLGSLSVDGIVYLSTVGSRKVTFPNLYADLTRLLSEEAGRTLETLYKTPQVPTAAKVNALLANFPRGLTLVLLDGFETALDSESGELKDAELNEALWAFVMAPQHAVKIILTTQVLPEHLLTIQPGRHAQLDLEEGLSSPYAENLLRELDSSGKIGLKTAPDDLLDTAREQTHGYPRALEALFGILASDWDSSLEDLLAETKSLLPENVVEVLVGEAFSRLDREGQQVLQALAIYGSPVPSTAIDYLLQPYVPGVDSAPVITRLVNTQLVRKEAGRYYLDPVDRTYALTRMPPGDLEDRENVDEPPFTQYALRHRAANYFEAVRLPRENWKTLLDLEPQIAEFELRLAGEDYETAALVLLEIDSDYLMPWGYFRLIVDLHERLQGHLTDSTLKEGSLLGLGNSYYRLGQLQMAEICYLQALESARESHHRDKESRALLNVGNYFGEIGQLTKAIEIYEQALAIYRERGKRRDEGIVLMNLGNDYTELGQEIRAVEYYNQALKLSREVGHRAGEALTLYNLGYAYLQLGHITDARERYEEGLTIARQIGENFVASACLVGLGRLLLHDDQPMEAIAHFEEALKLLDIMGNAQFQHVARANLAKAYLSRGDLTTARKTAERAHQHQNPKENPGTLALLGVIALRQGDHHYSRNAFLKAIEEAEQLRVKNQHNFRALDSKALAQYGLGLCEAEGTLVSNAIQTFSAARKIYKSPGYLKEVLALFDVLALEDSPRRRAKVRRTAAGEF